VTAVVELATLVMVEIGVALENQSGAEPVWLAKTINPIAKSRGRISRM
jgi:hypothetical protein